MDLRSISDPGPFSDPTPPFVAHGFCLPRHSMAAVSLNPTSALWV